MGRDADQLPRGLRADSRHEVCDAERHRRWKRQRARPVHRPQQLDLSLQETTTIFIATVGWATCANVRRPSSREKSQRADAHRPHVLHGSQVRVSQDLLRGSHVGGGAGRGSAEGSIDGGHRAEVSHRPRAIRFQDDVRHAQIQMGASHDSMQMIHPVEHVAEDAGRPLQALLAASLLREVPLPPLFNSIPR